MLHLGQRVFPCTPGGLGAAVPEIHGHAGGCIRVGGGVRARPPLKPIVAVAPDQGVVARVALQEVISRSTLEDIGVAVPQEDVVIPGAHQVLDPRQSVRSVSSGVLSTWNPEVDRHPRFGVRVRGGVASRTTVEKVVSTAPLQGVITGAAREHVVPFTALQDVGSVVTGQGVVEGRAHQVLHGGQAVDPGHARVLRGGQGQVDPHTGGVPVRFQVLIGDRVRARTADQGVVSQTPGQEVIAPSPVQPVVALAAQENVLPFAAFQPVAARTSGQHVVPVVPDQGVAVARSLQVLDALQGVRVAKAVRGDSRGQAGHDTRPVRHERGRVGSLPADQGVRPDPADQGVVAGRAVQEVGRFVSDQDVVMGGTLQILHVLHPVPARTERVLGPGDAQVDPHPGRGACKGGGVAPRTTVEEVVSIAPLQEVVPAAPLEEVVASQTRQGVGAAVAHEDVVVLRAHEVLDPQQGVRFTALLVDHLGRSEQTQVDPNPPKRLGIGHGVHARAPVQPVVVQPPVEEVVSGAALQDVIAGAAREDVVPVVPREPVRTAGTFQVLHGDQGVQTGPDRVLGCGRLLGVRTQGQAHRDPKSRVGVRGRVRASAAQEHVVALTPFQGVVPLASVQAIVAGAAGQAVVAVVSHQCVVVGGAFHVLHEREPVLPAEPVLRFSQGQIHPDPGRVVHIGGRVAPGPSVQQIVASAALQDVVASQTAQGIVPGVPGQAVVEPGARQMLEAAKGVAAAAARVLRTGNGERDGHPVTGVGIGRRVRTGSAVQEVVPARVAVAALEGVVPLAAEELVMSRAPVQEVIAGAAGDVVRTLLTEQGVIASSSVQNVVTRAPVDPIDVRASGQPVAVVRAPQVRDADQGVGARPLRVLRRLGAQVHEDPGPGVLIGGRVVPLAAAQEIVALAAQKDVFTLSPVQLVVAGPAHEPVGLFIADQDVVVVGPHQVLDVLQDIPSLGPRVLGFLNAQVHGHPRRCAGEGGRVRAFVPLEHVVARTPQERVVAAPALEGVVAGPPVQGVPAQAAPKDVAPVAPLKEVRSAHAFDHVVSGTADHHIVQSVSPDLVVPGPGRHVVDALHPGGPLGRAEALVVLGRQIHADGRGPGGVVQRVRRAGSAVDGPVEDRPVLKDEGVRSRASDEGFETGQPVEGPVPVRDRHQAPCVDGEGERGGDAGEVEGVGDAHGGIRGQKVLVDPEGRVVEDSIR